MSSQGENTEPYSFVFEPLRGWTFRINVPTLSGYIPMTSLGWSVPPPVCTCRLPPRENALRMYSCLRDSVRDLQVHDHDGMIFFELQREQSLGAVNKGSTLSPKDRSCGSWPPLASVILENGPSLCLTRPHARGLLIHLQVLSLLNLLLTLGISHP